MTCIGSNLCRRCLKYLSFLFCSTMLGKGKGKRSKSSDNGHPESPEKVSKVFIGSPVFRLSDFLIKDEIKKKLKCSWDSSNDAFESSNSDITVIKEPFTCCALKNVLHPNESIQELIQELKDVTFHEKNNDLYKFKQSGDLKSVDSPNVVAFRTFLSTTMKPWLQETTGFQLNDEIDAFCARYDYTDYLLCHDDQLEGRKIAYIFYLVPPTWKERDGGHLQLFSTNDRGEPDSVLKSCVALTKQFCIFRGGLPSLFIRLPKS